MTVACFRVLGSPGAIQPADINGESGFDSGEGALKTATTSKEGSRHKNYKKIAFSFLLLPSRVIEHTQPSVK